MSTLIGDGGDNTLSGTSGADSLSGVDGDDSLSGLQGNDTVDGADGNDTIVGGAGDDVLIGGNGNDSLSGGSENDTLDGGAGSDTLVGGTGADSMAGGAGDDIYNLDDAGDVIAENANEGTDNVKLTLGSYTLGANLELLTYLGTGNFTGLGNGLDNTITGGNGDDTLDGGAGADSLIGGNGNDTYIVDQTTDIVSESSGASSGIDTVLASASAYTLPGNVENLSFTGSGNFAGSGNGLDNAIAGGSGDDTLSGGNGNDTLTGQDGDDSLTGGSGNNSLSGGNGVDTASYSSAPAGANIDLTAGSAANGFGGSDTLSGIENVVGSAFNDTIAGDTGDNSLTGGAGDDIFLFRAQDLTSGDWVLGGSGTDRLKFTTAGTVVSGAFNHVSGIGIIELASGINTITLSDTLVSSSENAQLTIDASASAGATTVTASSLTSGHTVILKGGSDADTFALGSGGGSSVDGGPGTDTVSYASAGAAVVVDLVSGTGTDTLQSIENVTGSSFNDTITANSGVNSLTGGAGDDLFLFRIEDLTSADTVLGGAGNDTLRFTTAGTIAASAFAGLSGLGVLILADGANTIALSNGLVSASENQRLSVDGSASSGASLIDASSVASPNDVLLKGGSGADTFMGGGGDDTFDGGSGVDTVDFSHASSAVTVDLGVSTAQAIGGGQGTDQLLAIENLVGSDFDDILIGSGTDNSLVGGDGNDCLTGNDGNDTLSGGNNNDTLDGGPGNDLLLGGDRNDMLIGGAGNDTLDGGAGNDTASYSSDSSGIDVDLAAGTAHGTSSGSDSLIGIENVTGGSGGDTFIGDANGNSLAGNGGADWLDGGSGNDTLSGGAGDDTLIGGDDIDTVTYAGDTAGVNASLALGLVTGSATGTDSLAGIENLTGGSGNDTLEGNAGANVINGGAGDDSILGGNGNDTLAGGSGNDTLSGGDGIDSVSFSGDSSGVTASLVSGTASSPTSGSDVLIGIEGLIGGSGADTLIGDAGDNVLSGSGGNDSLEGGSGNDSLTGGGGNDTLAGGIGIDTVLFLQDSTGATVNLVLGTASGTSIGTDVLTGIENAAGGSGSDTLIGDGNGNVFTGNGGDDSIDGGAGIDTVIYSGGRENYIVTLSADGATIADTRFQSPDGTDTITRIEYAQFSNGTLAFADLSDTPPIAITDAGVALEAGGTNNGSPGSHAIGNVLTNDTDADSGDTKTVQGVAAGNVSGPLATGAGSLISGAFGSLLVNADGSYSYAVDDANASVQALAPGASLNDIFTYTMRDGAGANSSATLTIIVNGADDAPSQPIDNNAAANIVAEGAANGTAVGVIAFASDVDGGTLHYSLSDDAGGRFTIDSSTGVVTVANGSLIDYETAVSHSVTVLVGDGVLTSAQTFTIQVSDIAPLASSDSNAAANSVEEGVANGTAVGITASSTDVNGGTVTYSLTDNAGGRFAINAATGIVTVANGTLLDYETATSHSITVKAADASGAFSTQSFTVAVTDVDGRTITGTSFSDTIDASNTPAGQSFPTDGKDTIQGLDGTDSLSGLGGADLLQGGAGDDTLMGGPGDDTLDGGTNVDTAVYSGPRSAYAITHNGWDASVTGREGTDLLSSIERLSFSDGSIALPRGTGIAIDFVHSNPASYMAAIRDFDGNDLGGASGWELIGQTDVQNDGDLEYVYFNRLIGRWATVGPAADGKIFFDNFNWGGDTRVVGIYIDPLVEAGAVIKGSDFDSQRRFQNDLVIGNINTILAAGDYDRDGFQEIYFGLTDRTAYLHAYMHADGNIRYANYQSVDSDANRPPFRFQIAHDSEMKSPTIPK